jgi:hypothetical protein
MKRVVAAVVLISCFAALPREGLAQVTLNVGTVKGILNALAITTSVPAIGLGGSGTAVTEDASYAALNPAIFAGANHAMAYTASLDAPDRAAVRNLQMSGAFSFKALGLDLRAGLGILYTSRKTSPLQLRLTTPFVPVDTTIVSKRDDDYFGVPLAAAIKLNKLNFSVGFTPKQVRVRDEGLGLKEDATVYDVGGALWRPIKITRDSNLVPSVGASYLNAGSDEFFKIPGVIRYGARLRYENWRWSEYGEWAGPDTPFFAFSVTYDAIDPQIEGQVFQYGLGAEMAFLELVFIRGGWRDDGTDGQAILGAGLGPVTDHFMIRIDGAWSEGDTGAVSFAAALLF